MYRQNNNIQVIIDQNPFSCRLSKKGTIERKSVRTHWSAIFVDFRAVQITDSI
jgi:hypothetical protein